MYRANDGEEAMLPVTKSGAPKSSDRTVSRLSLCLQLTNTILLVSAIITFVVAAAHISRVVETKTGHDAVSNAVRDALNTLANDADVHRSLSQLAGSVSSVFFFGSSNGSVADFVMNFFSSDIQGFAKAVSSFSLDIATVFEHNLRPASCSQTLTCPRGGIDVQCANGRVVYCPTQGAVVSCSYVACINSQPAFYASMVHSVADAIATWTNINADTVSAAERNFSAATQQMTPGLPHGSVALDTEGSTPWPANTSDAAFSDGIFRLDTMLTWLRAQTRSPDWGRLGTMCRLATHQLRNMPLNGTYFDPIDRTAHSWSWTNAVSQNIGFVEQVCEALTALPQRTATS
eukprot:TRINITY_DN662_c0_g3_i1.p1 TRINITY_DN662_c0_g3~~TRINITY_DN662_c0_g3_i1.p1  ORF type:complete len:346 (-),score=90.32 TRINITY_DN662_c0_g3_i1:331-1368(-)